MIEHGTIRIERRIAAPADVVYGFLVDGSRWARWQGASAEANARAGGTYSLWMPTGQVASGRFVELLPNRRVVFTWGWVGDEAVPPGSSTVEIDLEPDGEGTIVRLTHRDLPDGALDAHAAGWEHYLPRLATVAEGGDPGPDAMPG